MKIVFLLVGPAATLLLLLIGTFVLRFFVWLLSWVLPLLLSFVQQMKVGFLLMMLSKVQAA